MNVIFDCLAMVRHSTQHYGKDTTLSKYGKVIFTVWCMCQMTLKDEILAMCKVRSISSGLVYQNILDAGENN